MPLRPLIEAKYVRPDSVDDYSVTSPSTDDYNCIAWAAGRDDVWAWPGEERYHWWPPDLARNPTLAGLADWFRSLGYEPTDSLDFEEGYERVVLYSLADGTPTHAARQTGPGSWTSKIGQAEDISHRSAHVLEVDSGYGRVKVVLRRPVTAGYGSNLQRSATSPRLPRFASNG